MAQSTPHILIEADPELTERVWHASARKPFVLAPADQASRLQDKYTESGDPYLLRFFALDIIGHVLKGQRSEQYGHLLRILDDIRRYFGNEGEALRISVVGSHTTISSAITNGYQLAGGDLNYLIDEHFLLGMRRHRQLAGLLGAALQKLPNVVTPWLAPIYQDLRPSIDPPLEDLIELAARARSDQDVLNFEQSELELRLSRPVSPLIYLRAPGRKLWEPLGFTKGRPPYWTTDSLIRQFKERCADEPKLEGVLVKVVGTDTRQYCPVDAPVVGTRTLDAAAGTNISAILLDKEFGILRPFNLSGRLSPPVYRV